MLYVVTWFWGKKFGAEHVNRLWSALKRNIKQPYRFMIARPGLEDEHLIHIPGCFVRMRMFDPQWQTDRQIMQDSRIVCVDLDTVITGELDPLFDRPESFVIMQGGNAVNPCPYNGALMMLRAGKHQEVWADFSVEAASAIPFYKYPEDQAWLWHKIPNAAGWKCGPESGVYVYQKPGWPGGKKRESLPAGARLVTFINRDPKQLMHLDWVRENWQ